MASAVYLVSGDDDAKLDAWRLRLRRRAEQAGGPGALEAYDAASSPPDAVAAALASLTLTGEDRHILVDGVEQWKPADLDSLERELPILDATILLLIARGKPSPRLAKGVAAAGGETRRYESPKPWQLPGWARERARELGVELDGDAAKVLVAIVGPRQQRLASELERLQIAIHPRATLTAADVRELAAGETSEQVYGLADALVAGDASATMRIAERLAEAGERPTKLTWAVVRRLREIHRLLEMLDAGVPEKSAQAALRMPPWAFKRAVAQARSADREALGRALCAFADLEVEVRGGGSGLDEDTAFSLTLARAAGPPLAA